MSGANASLDRRLHLKSGRAARYEAMFEIRTFEDRVQAMFFEGLVHGTTHTCQGQEAVSVGIAAAARPTDSVTCTYRGHGHALALGMPPLTVLAEIMGRRIGSVGGLGGSMHLCDTSVGLLPTFAIVGAGIPVAAGAALTAQVKGTDGAAIAIFGDGAANIGAFHEGLNLAAIWNLPAVFICENNQYGEYSAIHLTTPVENIADRAASYGIPGEVVDGQDVDTVEAAVSVALARARAGEGPTLLEMKTYRYAGHSRADTAPYRPEGEFDRWYERDPINTYRRRLIEDGEMTEEEAEQIEARVAARIAEAEAEASAADQATVEDMFTNIHAP
ncbi:thiamine pyrophosphate-dependent dehydrogenase E1 component subunit alpha [Candidatus Spongiisocius sp.]|uniref:thiamine pyrophosphate-dependent dehydrogenase E1 component subunit alpha n=1 Tax=Candidatus Spongiisocius sp. TaxID=3101273 RepID=UPI003B5C2089